MTHSTAAALLATRDSTSYDLDDWRDRARCLGVDVNVFFPSAVGPAMYDQARTYCASCPVQMECLNDALDTGFAWRDDGFRGGKTPSQRQELRGRVRYERLTCAVCLRSFVSARHRQALYCSQDCRNVVRAERMRKARAS